MQELGRHSPRWVGMNPHQITTFQDSITCVQQQIFSVDIDVAIGGMDQRKAHMYMGDVAEKWKWKKISCLCSIISLLKSSGARMESFDRMSKSDPNSALLLHDPVERIKKKIRKHALIQKMIILYEIQDIILPEFGKVVVTLTLEPSTWKFGGFQVSSKGWYSSYGPKFGLLME